MMLNFSNLIKTHKIKPNGVIQLGAHYFQERDEFVKLGIKDFVLVEPQKHAFEVLKTKCNAINVKAFQCAISDFEGQAEMFCDLGEGQSSSILKPKKHTEEYPSIEFKRKEIVTVRLLKNLDFDHYKYNILVMDLQGNELKALKGSGTILNHIDAIYTEVNFIELYEDCALIWQLDDYLHAFGFKRVDTGKATNGWTDAFYIKTNRFYEKI
jgi:FkbM family methyltransferase